VNQILFRNFENPKLAMDELMEPANLYVF
jgi:hypothetical protein